jgi:molybdenum cofactor biosynthesis enzyme
MEKSLDLTVQEQLQEDLELLYESRRNLYKGHENAALKGHHATAETIWDGIKRVDEAIFRAQEELSDIS